MGDNILVTGAAGFIGFHTTLRLLERGVKVVGLDNLNDSYDPSLKKLRLRQILESTQAANFSFVEGDLADATLIQRLFSEIAYDQVVHLGAQVGVRYSLINPKAYIDSNLNGFFNVIDAAARAKIKHLVYASSSSVYGLNAQAPFLEDQNVDYPLNLYAATKKSNELMAHSYAHLYGLPCSGLRFFTVYGPWGRPDMAVWLFSQAITQGKPLQLFNQGKMLRDFTYVDDIVEGILGVLDRPPTTTESAPSRILNIGNRTPTEVSHVISILEKLIGKKAIVQHQPLHPGDMFTTCANTDRLQKLTGVTPQTSIESGLKHFIHWYQGYLDKS